MNLRVGADSNPDDSFDFFSVVKTLRCLVSCKMSSDVGRCLLASVKRTTFTHNGKDKRDFQCARLEILVGSPFGLTGEMVAVLSSPCPICERD